MPRDYYEVLGIGKDADVAQIKNHLAFYSSKVAVEEV